MPRRCLLLLALVLLALPGCARRAAPGARPQVRISAKGFAESEILGEMLRHLAEEAGAEAEPLATVGDSNKLWQSLQIGQTDAYCEYVGTLSQELLAGEVTSAPASIRRALARRGLRMSRSLGFSNSYGLGMKRKRAAQLHIRAISDLRRHPDLKVAVSTPFLKRPDGWQSLRRHYDLPQDTHNGMEHQLAYQALEAGNVDLTDVYTTDTEILKDDLVVLEDDRHFFPAYDAVILYRADLDRRAPEVVDALLGLEGTIDEPTMIALNARVKINKESPQAAAVGFLNEKLHMAAQLEEETLWQRLWVRTREHLLLVSVSLVLAIAVAVPLGIVAARWPRLGFVLLGAIAIVQTIPALALLVLLLVLLKTLGALPAIVALFLYSLLPIVRNTHTGLQGIAPQMRESAEALGLSPWARLRLIELPLASPAILAGIKTAAVVNVGYATLGGLIGAGGYGEPIMDGVMRADYQRTLEGAIPAVVMALAVQVLFDLLERVLVPRGLRLKPAE